MPIEEEIPTIEETLPAIGEVFSASQKSSPAMEEIVNVIKESACPDVRNFSHRKSESAMEEGISVMKKRGS